MRSPKKYILVATLLWGVAAQAQDRPAGSVTDVSDEHMDRIARIANKFKGSIFLFDQSISPDVLDHAAEQSARPSYQWWLSFRPRYYFKPNLSLRVRMDLTVEWVDGVVDTTYKYEPLFGDLWTDLAYSPRTFAGIVPTLAFRAVWGTSKEAQAQGDVVNIGPALSFVREFQTKKAGSFELSLSMYGLFHAGAREASSRTSYSCADIEFRNTSCNSLTGRANTAFNLTTFVSGSWSPIKQLTIGLTYAILDGWGWNVPDITLENGQPVDHSADDQRLRQSQWFLANIDYMPRDWITLSLGYYCLRPILNQDSTYGNPFYYKAGDTQSTRIYLTTTINLDRVYDVAARRVQRNKASTEAAPPIKGANLAWWR